MWHKMRPCPDCGSEMNYRLGEYICSACEYTEPAFAQLLEEEVELLDIPDQAPAEMAVEDSGTAGASQVPAAGYLVPPPPLMPDGRLGQPALGKASAEITAARSMKLRGEKIACLVAYAAILIYGAVSSYLTLPQVMQQLYAGLQQEVDDSLSLIPSIDLSGHAGAVALMAGIYILLQLGIMWWVLFRAAAWIKWCSIGCALLTVLSTLGFTPWLVLGALPGISRAQMLLAEVLQLAWQAWVASLLFRDIRLRQRE